MADSKTPVLTPMIPVGWGEVFDKISILEIKERKITEPSALRNVKTELEALRGVVGQFCANAVEISELKNELAKINAALWVVEDRLREYEAKGDFCLDFINDARAVYKLNDRRAAVKKQINVMCFSGITEEKSYAQKG